MNKVIPYIAVVLILFGGYHFFVSSQCLGYSCISFAGMEQYRIEEEYESSSKAYRALLRHDKVNIRIEVYADISTEKAASYDKIKIMNIESLYETAKSPYPGALSNEIECGKEYRPRVGKITINAVPSTYIQGYLNDRLQYGACLKEELEYESSLVLFHCPSQRRWYQFEIITPLGQQMDDKRILNSLTCK